MQTLGHPRRASLFQQGVFRHDDVMLLYPNYKKAFDLTTDASSFGLGAVLPLGGKRITMKL